MKLTLTQQYILESIQSYGSHITYEVQKRENAAALKLIKMGVVTAEESEANDLKILILKLK